VNYRDLCKAGDPPRDFNSGFRSSANEQVDANALLTDTPAGRLTPRTEASEPLSKISGGDTGARWRFTVGLLQAAVNHDASFNHPAGDERPQHSRRSFNQVFPALATSLTSLSLSLSPSRTHCDPPFTLAASLDASGRYRRGISPPRRVSLFLVFRCPFRSITTLRSPRCVCGRTTRPLARAAAPSAPPVCVVE